LPQWRGGDETAIVGKALAGQLVRQLEAKHT